MATIVYPTDYPNSYKTGTVSVVVSEYPAPTITLDGSTTSYEGETKQYTVTHDSSSPVAISWTLNGTVIDGATGTSVDIPFTTVGTQNVAVSVNLTAYPNSKRTGTISVVVSEYPAPTITMGGSTTSIVGETKQYSVTSTSTDPLTIAWSINGTVIEGATGTSVDIPFSATGNYDVSVSVYPTAYPNSKRTGTVSVVVSEYPAPIITIAGSTTSIVGETKQYTVTSPSTDPLKIAWSLNGTVIDGAVGVSVDIPFATAGTQNAAVIVYPTAYPNSKATSAISVVVSEYPAPMITLDGPMTSNVGETKRYTATSTSTDPLTISWTLNGAVIDGDTGTSVDIPFTMAGPQNVGVTVYSTAYPDSKKTSSILVMVSQYPAPSITMDGPTTAIAGGTGQYTVTHDSSLPVTIAWTLNGIVIEGAIGASVDVSFATTGNSTVAVTVYPTAHPDSKRTGSIPVVVSEYKAPSITMAGPRTSAVGGTGQYTVTHNSSLPVSIAWTLNGNVIEGATGASVGIPFTAAGSYDVGVTVYPTAYPDSKRTGSLAVAVSEVKAPLVGLSTIKSGVVGNTITLKATAVGQIAGIPLVVKWKLPDGTSVDALTTTYTPRLEDVGTATFKFTAYPEGYPDSTKESELQVPITNYALPTFTLRNYTKNTGIAPWIVVYGANANLTGITSGTLTYTWDMGDGSAVKPNKNKATHTYTQPGNYTVTLTVTDAKGNSTVVTDMIIVTPVSPISVDAITVTGTNKYMRAPVVGIFKSTISGGNPKADRFVNFTWTVNGQPVGRNSSQATYEFKEPGTYEIGLTVTSMSGLTGSGTTTVAVKENIPPECTIEATDYPDRKYTKLLSKCTDEDGRIRSWSWDLGNGQTKNTGTVYATYAESGTYTVSLTATDDSGSSVTVSQDVSAQR